MKKFGLLAAAVLGFAGMARGDDHGDSPATATPLDLGVVVQGVLNSGGDADFFQTVLAPNSWYGFALFGDPLWNIDLKVEDDEGQIWAYDLGSTAFRNNPFDEYIWTNYPVVRYYDSDQGSGGDGYRLTSVRFPDSPSPLNTLLEFPLDAVHPVDARYFNFETGGEYVIGMSPLADEGESPQMANWSGIPEGSWYGGMINYGQHVQVIAMEGPGFLRTLVHNPDWDRMLAGVGNIGVRVQAFVTNALSAGGAGTGRISAACEVDGWTMEIQPETRYAVWLNDPDGRISSDYDLAVIQINGNSRGVQDSAGGGKLVFDSYEADIFDSYAFTVFSRAARDQDYTLNAQSYVDDFGEWEGDTPEVGFATPNVPAGGNLEVPPDEDGFRVPMQSGMTYAFYSPDEDRFDFSMDGDWDWSGNYWGWQFTAPESGTGGVRVAYGWGSEATTGAYQFVVSEFADDADNDASNAIPLTVGGPATANDFKAPGDTDWFAFNVETDKTYTLTGGAGHQIEIYFNEDWGSWIADGPSLTFPVDYTGPCYATIRATPTAGDYSASVVEGDGSSPDYNEWALGIDWGGQPSGPGDDADGDGFSNDEERIADTNPTVEGDLFKSTAAATTTNGTGLVLGNAVAGRVYSARYTTNLLLDWSQWLPATLSIVDGKIVAAIDPLRPNAVYRLIVALE